MFDCCATSAASAILAAIYTRSISSMEMANECARAANVGYWEHKGICRICACTYGQRFGPVVHASVGLAQARTNKEMPDGLGLSAVASDFVRGSECPALSVWQHDCMLT